MVDDAAVVVADPPPFISILSFLILLCRSSIFSLLTAFAAMELTEAVDVMMTGETETRASFAIDVVFSFNDVTAFVDSFSCI